MIRHSKETFATLFAWYASCALVGVAALLMVGVVLRSAGYPLTAENVLLGMGIVAPLLVAAMVLAWSRVEPVYRAQQVKAMLTSVSGLNALDETPKRKHRD